MRRLMAITVLAVVVTSACGVKTGDDAVDQMSPHQLIVVAKLQVFSSLTTADDLIVAFGSPVDQGVVGSNPEWFFTHGDTETRLTAYYENDGLTRIQYQTVSPRWSYVLHYDSNGPVTGRYPATEQLAAN